MKASGLIKNNKEYPILTYPLSQASVNKNVFRPHQKLYTEGVDYIMTIHSSL